MRSAYFRCATDFTLVDAPWISRLRKQTRTIANADGWEYLRAIHSRTLLMKHDVIQAALVLYPGRHIQRRAHSQSLPGPAQRIADGAVQAGEREYAIEPDVLLNQVLRGLGADAGNDRRDAE